MQFHSRYLLHFLSHHKSDKQYRKGGENSANIRKSIQEQSAKKSYQRKESAMALRELCVFSMNGTSLQMERISADINAEDIVSLCTQESTM